MKRTKIKILASILVFTVIFTIGAYPAYASDNNYTTLDSLSKTPITMMSDRDVNNMKASINKMSDKEFDDFITTYISNEVDHNNAKEKLEKLGVEVNFQEKNPSIVLQSLSPSYVTLSTYSAHRGHDTYYRLFCSFDYSGYSESKPATYDVLGMFFNTNMASYYGSNQSDTNYAWLKDSSQYLNGTILFNVDDSKFNRFTGTQYVAVYVIPTSTGTFVYGDKYVHTYNTTSTSTSGSASVSFSGTGVAGSIGFSVNTSTIETNWEKGDDNALTW